MSSCIISKGSLFISFFIFTFDLSDYVLYSDSIVHYHILVDSWSIFWSFYALFPQLKHTQRVTKSSTHLINFNIFLLCCLMLMIFWRSMSSSGQWTRFDDCWISWQKFWNIRLFYFQLCRSHIFRVLSINGINTLNTFLALSFVYHFNYL